MSTVNLAAPAASTAVSSLSLRIAASAGVGASPILVLNAAKRAELVPSTALTQLLAPLAEALSILFVIGLSILAGRGRSGALTVVTALNVVALALLAGVEMVINLVFAEVTMAQVDDLLTGPLGTGLMIVSVLFLVATMAYAATLLRADIAPRLPLLVYAVAAVPVSLRALVPEWALVAGVIGLAVGIGWLSVWAYQAATRRVPGTEGAPR